MGFFKKFGSFFGAGSKPVKSVAPRLAGTARKRGTQMGGKLRETLGEQIEGWGEPSAGKPGSLRSTIESWDVGEAMAPTTEDRLYDLHQSQLKEEEIKEAELRRQQMYSPVEKFLLGELVNVVSSNVAMIQYDNDLKILYIAFKNGYWYQYFQVSAIEAEGIFNAGSKGGWVWDNLRIRGTVFGSKKVYAFMEFAMPGSHQPRYMETATWQKEHASIGPDGKVPESWIAGMGPYPPWFGITAGQEKPKRTIEETLYARHQRDTKKKK